MYHFIVNPNARTGLGLKIWNKIEKILKEKEVEYICHQTEYQGHATDIVRDLTSDGKEHTIIAMGGDGTVNEVVNGITYPEKVTFGYIPIGSGNDFARGLGLPGDPDDAINNILKPTNVQPFNLGIVEYGDTKRRFAVSSGIGYDADVCHYVGVSPVKALLNKLKLGKLTYLVVAVERLMAMKPYKMSLQMDDGKTILFDKVYFTAAQNLPYEGGGFKFCPAANPGDAVLDIILAEGFNKLQILCLLPTAFMGWHVKFKGIHIYTCKKAVITSSPYGPLHTDGEPLFAHPEVRYSLEAEAIRLIGSPKR